MAETLIFEQDVTFVDGLFSVAPAPFILSINETYRVVWGTDTYECVAAEVIDADLLFSAIGNSLLFGGEDDGIPFGLCYSSDLDVVIVSSMYTPSMTVSIAIYHVEEDKDIILYNREGVAVPYEGVSVVQLLTSEGDVKEYVDSDTIPEVLEDISIAVDFSNGNQIIEAPEGMAVKTAILQKPDTLIPANIVKGVVIAGVEGTNEGGGSGELDETLKYFVGSIDPTAGTFTIHSINYDALYADNGNYDVVVPDTISGMAVILKCG